MGSTKREVWVDQVPELEGFAELVAGYLTLTQVAERNHASRQAAKYWFDRGHFPGARKITIPGTMVILIPQGEADVPDPANE